MLKDQPTSPFPFEALLEYGEEDGLGKYSHMLQQ